MKDFKISSRRVECGRVQAVTSALSPPTPIPVTNQARPNHLTKRFCFSRASVSPVSSNYFESHRAKCCTNIDPQTWLTHIHVDSSPG